MVVDFLENEKQFLAIRSQIFDQEFIKRDVKQPSHDTVMDDTNYEEANDTITKLSTVNEEKSTGNLIVHFQYEQRMKSCQKDIHSIWDRATKSTIIKSTRLIVGTCNSRNGITEMVTKHPLFKSLKLAQTSK